MQTAALQAAGTEKIYNDRISGAKTERVGLDDLLSHARAGDVVIVWRLDRLAETACR